MVKALQRYIERYIAIRNETRSCDVSLEEAYPVCSHLRGPSLTSLYSAIYRPIPPPLYTAPTPKR